MRIGLIVEQAAGKLVPEAFLTRTLAAFTNNFGCSTMLDGKMALNRFNRVTPSITDLQELQTNAGDNKLVLFFGNADTEPVENDVSPYPVLRHADGEAALLAFVEGSFPGFEKPNSAMSPEFHFFEDYLVPKFTSIFNANERDVDTFMSEIKKPIYGMDVTGQIGSRGSVLLFASNGASIRWSKGSTAKNFEWGWVSDTLGYEEKAYPEPEKEPEVSKNQFLLKPKPAAQTPTTTKVGETTVIHKPKPAASVPEVKTETAVTPPATAEKFLQKPYGWDGWDKKTKQNWLVKWTATGQVFSGYKNQWNSKVKARPEYDHTAFLAKESDKDESTSTVEVHEPETPAVETPAAEPAKVPIIKPQPAPATQVRIVTPEERTKIDKALAEPHLKSIIDKNNTLIKDPAALVGKTITMPTFHDQVGKTLDEVANWPIEAYETVARETPAAAALLMRDLRHAYLTIKNAAQATTTIKKPEPAKKSA